MSIASNMKKYMLQVKDDSKRSTSGSKIIAWNYVKEIDVSVFKKNSTLNTQNVKYNDCTHTGITFYQDIKTGRNRLVSDDKVFDVIDSTPGRKTVLLLKEVDTNV